MVEYLQKLLENPIIGHLVTRDEKHHTLRKMFLSAAIMEESNRLVVYIPEAGMDGIRRNLQVSDYVAVLITDIVTYEGVQMKGNASIRAATCSEEDYFEMMLQGLAAFAIPLGYSTRSINLS